MAAIKEVSSTGIASNTSPQLQPGIVLLSGFSTNFVNKEVGLPVPTLILRTPQETLGVTAQPQQHIQLQPNLSFYSVVLNHEMLRGSTLPLVGLNGRKSPAVETSTLSVNSKSSNEQLAPKVVACQQIPSKKPATHIEIIRQKPSIVKAKHGASRRVTGANRVVPLITSMWQKREPKAVEPSLAATYKTILDDPDNSDEHECEICRKRFLSAMQVEHHIKVIHHQDHVVSEQCFVCRKKYVFQSQLKRHLSVVHGIQYPEMICKICFMEFTTAMEQKAHERKHDKIYSCQYCSTKFASEYFCQKHYDQHLVHIKPFQCQSCGKRFHDGISLSIHEKRHKRLTCSFCDVPFEEELSLVIHVKDHGEQGKRQFLTTVEQLDREEVQLEDMLGMYLKSSYAGRYEGVDRGVSDCMEGLLCSVSQTQDTGIPVPEKKGVECKLCGLEVPSAKELIEHRRSNHVRSCTCLICGKRSRSVSQTWRHMSTHIDKISPEKMENERQCHVCQKVFPTKTKKNVHLERIHKIETTQRPYSCTVCSRKFRHTTSRDRHMLLHGKDKTGLKCAVCDQVFLRPKFLLKHVAEHESRNECHVCNKTFSRRRHLKIHLNTHRLPGARKKFKCSHCPVMCRGMSGLRDHIRTHTRECPFACSQCKMKFKRLQALKKHMKTVHHGPGAVRLQCSRCSILFNDKGNLLRHFLRIHCGLRRFICGLCGVRYGQNHDLRRHLKAKHEIEMPVISGAERKSLTEIYVLPAIEKMLPAHVEKINRLVAEEKSKLVDLRDLLSKMSGHTSQKSIEILHKKLETAVTNDVTEKPVEDTSKLQMCEQQVSESFVPLVMGEKSQFIKIQTCSQCQKLMCAESTESAAEKDGTKTLCKSCVDGALYKQNGAPEKTLTLFKYGHYLPDLLDRDVPIKHSESRQERTLSAATSNVDQNGELVQRNTGTSSPPVLVPNVVLHSGTDIQVPTTFSNQSSIPVFCTTVPQASLSNITPGANIPSAEEMVSVSEVVVPKVPIPMLSSANETMSCSKTEKEHAGKTEVKTLVNQSSKSADGAECTCKQCGKTFSFIANLERHLKTHTGTRPFSCAQCGKHFSEKHNMKVHMRTHTGERPYVCTICGKQMRYQRDFTDHKKIHLGIKPFECTECGHRFLRKREFVRHKITHTGEKKFKCPICDKAFGRLDQLKLVHMRQHRTETKPHFTCPTCHKDFSFKSKLEQHKITHIDQKKNYHCPMCSKAFARDVYLKSHLKVHKKRDSYVQCPKCPRRFASEQTLQVHEEKFHVRLQKSAKEPKQSRQQKKKLIQDTTVLEPELDTVDMEGMNLLGDDILVDDKGNTVIYLQMVPDLDLSLNSVC